MNFVLKVLMQYDKTEHVFDNFTGLILMRCTNTFCIFIVIFKFISLFWPVVFNEKPVNPATENSSNVTGNDRRPEIT